MIKGILHILSLDNYYGGSKEIEIAKGKHELAIGMKDMMNKLKRAYHAKDGNN